MIHFSAGSLKSTIVAMRGTSVTERQAAIAAVDAAGKLMHGLIRANISLRDYSLADLASMNPPHPYARRHGSIRIHTSGGGGTLVNPEFRVHTQSGTMLNALNHGRTTTASGGPNYMVWLDAGIAPHAPYVIRGTRVMLGRDVLWNTASAPGTRKMMMKVIVQELGAIMKTKSVLRFGRSDRPALPGGALEV